MAGITYEGIQKEISEKKLRPVYYLMGEESYYIDLLANRFATEILDEMEQEFNQTIVYAQDSDLRNILSLAKRYPMMADRQVIIVKEAQNFKNEIDELSLYLQKPQPSTVLVFCHKNGTLDRRKKVVGDIERAGGGVFESKKVRDDQLPYFIVNYVKNRSLSIEEKATMMLVESIGSDLNRMTSEIDKLFINMPAESKLITADMVEEFTGISKDYNIFELKSALVTKDVAKANRIIKYMEANPKNFPPQYVLPILFSYFANLQQDILPTDQCLRRPVAIGPLDNRRSVLGDFANDGLYVRSYDIVSVDQDRQTHFSHIIHRSIVSFLQAPHHPFRPQPQSARRAARPGNATSRGAPRRSSPTRSPTRPPRDAPCGESDSARARA